MDALGGGGQTAAAAAGGGATCDGHIPAHCCGCLRTGEPFPSMYAQHKPMSEQRSEELRCAIVPPSRKGTTVSSDGRASRWLRAYEEQVEEPERKRQRKNNEGDDDRVMTDLQQRLQVQCRLSAHSYGRPSDEPYANARFADVLELVLEWMISLEDPMEREGGKWLMACSKVSRSSRRVIMSSPRYRVALRTYMVRKAHRRADDARNLWRPILSSKALGYMLTELPAGTFITNLALGALQEVIEAHLTELLQISRYLCLHRLRPGDVDVWEDPEAALTGRDVRMARLLLMGLDVGSVFGKGRPDTMDVDVRAPASWSAAVEGERMGRSCECQDGGRQVREEGGGRQDEEQLEMPPASMEAGLLRVARRAGVVEYHARAVIAVLWAEVKRIVSLVTAGLRSTQKQQHRDGDSYAPRLDAHEKLIEQTLTGTPAARMLAQALRFVHYHSTCLSVTAALACEDGTLTEASTTSQQRHSDFEMFVVGLMASINVLQVDPDDWLSMQVILTELAVLLRPVMEAHGRELLRLADVLRRFRGRGSACTPTSTSDAEAVPLVARDVKLASVVLNWRSARGCPSFCPLVELAEVTPESLRWLGPWVTSMMRSVGALDAGSEAGAAVVVVGEITHALKRTLTMCAVLWPYYFRGHNAESETEEDVEDDRASTSSVSSSWCTTDRDEEEQQQEVVKEKDDDSAGSANCEDYDDKDDVARVEGYMQAVFEPGQIEDASRLYSRAIGIRDMGPVLRGLRREAVVCGRRVYGHGAMWSTPLPFGPREEGCDDIGGMAAAAGGGGGVAT